MLIVDDFSKLGEAFRRCLRRDGDLGPLSALAPGARCSDFLV